MDGKTTAKPHAASRTLFATSAMSQRSFSYLSPELRAAAAVSSALERVDKDREVFGFIAEAFMAEFPAMELRLGDALRRKDPEAIEASIKQVKSAVRLLAVADVMDSAEQIAACARRDPDRATQIWNELSETLHFVMGWFRKYSQQQPKHDA